MRRSAKNLRCHELIGLEVEVLDHSDRGLVGLAGRVVWETKNMLVIESSGREVWVPKGFGKFSFKLPGRGAPVVVDGWEIARAPEDRVKLCGWGR